MLEAANTDIFNPLFPKAHNSECQNLPFPSQINPISESKLIGAFLFVHPRH